MTEQNSKDWWEYYAEGKIIQRSDTPRMVVSTVEDWCIQCCLPKSNPMWQFALGKPVSPTKLQLEISECKASADQVTEKQQRALMEVERWAIREAKLAEATKDLWDAQQEFLSAVTDAGIDAYHAHKLECGPVGITEPRKV